MAHLRIAPTAMRMMALTMAIAPVYRGLGVSTGVGSGVASASAVGFAQLPLNVARHLALADRLALVVDVLAPGERNLHLCPRPVREVNPGGHERQAPLTSLADQPLDLGLVQQQLARALGIVVLPRGGAVRGDVGADQP